MKEHSHSIISICVVAVFSILGVGIYALLAVAGFYIGREHSQAEYRYMKLNKINRSKLKAIDAFKPEAWNKDSFINDMLLPIAVGVLTLITINQFTLLLFKA